MMSFEQKIKNELIARGMWPAQANEVFERVKADKASEAMKDCWNDSPLHSPDTMFAPIWMTVEKVAIEYIDETCSKAWFRPMFDPEQMKEAEAAYIAKKSS